MSKIKNAQKNTVSPVASMVALLKSRDEIESALAKVESELQTAILEAARVIPSVSVGNRTAEWSDKQGNSGTIVGETVEGKVKVTVDGVSRLLTLMSRINKGEGRFSHAVKGWAKVTAQEEEISSFEC